MSSISSTPALPRKTKFKSHLTILICRELALSICKIFQRLWIYNVSAGQAQNQVVAVRNPRSPNERVTIIEFIFPYLRLWCYYHRASFSNFSTTASILEILPYLKLWYFFYRHFGTGYKFSYIYYVLWVVQYAEQCFQIVTLQYIGRRRASWLSRRPELLYYIQTN